MGLLHRLRVASLTIPSAFAVGFGKVMGQLGWVLRGPHSKIKKSKMNSVDTAGRFLLHKGRDVEVLATSIKLANQYLPFSSRPIPSRRRRRQRKHALRGWRARWRKIAARHGMTCEFGVGYTFALTPKPEHTHAQLDQNNAFGSAVQTASKEASLDQPSESSTLVGSASGNQVDRVSVKRERTSCVLPAPVAKRRRQSPEVVIYQQTDQRLSQTARSAQDDVEQYFSVKGPSETTLESSVEEVGSPASSDASNQFTRLHQLVINAPDIESWLQSDAYTPEIQWVRLDPEGMGRYM